MHSIVVYASHFGNTRKIAEAITDVLRSRGVVQVFAADDAPLSVPTGTDLVVVGGPTEQHGMTQPMVRFFNRMRPETLEGLAAAAFDTRLRWPRWLSGSAGGDIATRLRRCGARLIVPPESFFVEGAARSGGSNGAELAEGELAHAAAWASMVAEACIARAPAPVS